MKLTQTHWTQASLLMFTVFVASSSVVRPARAAETPPPEPVAAAMPAASPEPEAKWYGWQTLIADAASLATAPVYVGIGGYFLAAPIVHGAHGNFGRAFASVGLRVLTPVTFAAIGAATCQHPRSEFGCLGPVLIGGMVGIPVAMLVDAFALAYEPVPKAKTRETKTEAGALRLRPNVAPHRGGGVDVGVVGTF